jgi:outer membrane protein TolC
MKALAAVLAVLALAGCASTGPDGGFGEVGQTVTSRTGAETKWVRSEDDAKAVRERVKQLLAKPLRAEDAVQVALLNSPGLQASYAQLGIASGDLLSTVLPNPRLSYLRARHGDEYKIETIFSFNVLSLLTVPMALEGQKQRFEQAKVEAAAEGLRVAAEARKAYWRALAAQQTAQYAEEVKMAAEAAAELARRMAAVGNFSKLDRMREQAFYAEATAQVARSRQAAVAERERLIRLMGLWGEETQFKLPERMPDIPAAARELPNLEEAAMESRLDIAAAKRDAEALAKALGLTRVTRFVSEFDLGIARVREDPEPTKKGYEIGVPIPLFDWGAGRVARAEALYMQAANRIAEAAINGRSEVRESYLAYRTAYDVAKHYREEVVPLRKQISDEVVLRYNGMLASVFELLVDAREQIAAVSASIDAQRDFWIADAHLQNAMNGRSSGPAGTGAMKASTPSASAGGH